MLRDSINTDEARKIQSATLKKQQSVLSDSGRLNVAVSKHDDVDVVMCDQVETPITMGRDPRGSCHSSRYIDTEMKSKRVETPDEQPAQASSYMPLS